MWNFQRIICIWICCVSCMFGTTQLSSLVAAVPYEYFDDHDQSFYDLDTEQIQAKYDTRLLSQQMLKTQQQQQQLQQQQQHHTHDSKKGSRSGIFEEDGVSHGRSHDSSFVLDNSKRNDGDVGSTDNVTKLKSNDASKNNNNMNSNNNNNINQRQDKDWLYETTPAITEKQEIHLPRAASCYTNGQKYTHGQKVPRHDSCEVCLCMDGEIFCWWEKCDKKPPKAQTMRYDDYSTPFEESSTVRIQPNEKSTVRTTLTPMKKPKINKDYADEEEEDDDDDDDGDDGDGNVDEDGEVNENNEYDDIKQRHNSKRPHKSHNKQMASKKLYGQQHQEALELKEKQMKMVKKEKLKKQQQQQQQQLQQHKTNNDHRYHHPEHHPSSGSSKILNFPENLPSVLYYDYKTEEHQHHQHQHREQHLKHQHEKELKHRQHSAVGRHHEYGDEVGQDFNTDTTVTALAAAAAVATSLRSGSGRRADDVVLHRQQQQQQPPSSAKYLGNGNDNIYNVDLQTDSDILPEPPTKKPKLPATASASAAGTPTTTLTYRSPTSPEAAALAATTTITTQPLKKQMFSPWDYDKPNRDKVNNSIKQRQQQHTDKSHDEDIAVVDEDQDDAFHRWLTSTEKNNKNNVALVGDAGFGGINDFLGDDKMYENIDIDIDAVSSSLQAQTTKPPASVTPTSTAVVVVEEGSQQNLENSGNLKYEINFSDTNTGSTDNSNSNTNNNDNISPFSNPYQNYKNNNNNPILMTTTTTTGGGKSQSANDGGSGGRLSSSSSNEDNGVGSVVNIDIMLTASADIAQQTDAKHQQHQLSSEHDKQIPGQPNAKQKPLLIYNTNEKDNVPLSLFSSSPTTANASNISSTGGDTQQTLGGNLFSSNFSSSASHSNNNSSNNSFSNSDSYKLNQPLVSNSTGASSAESAASSSSLQITPTTSTTLSPERQCNVMGTLYKIGDVLPQDTGNCLQCVCIDGSTMDDTPRVTCSPHNCPPLVLPDLFDATGY